mmetsp:Transcript_40258/g.110745  ORF Transcript_40258/g.110745 Transcript_40258/m.110745 type:complete len:344 (-) Transcript_40258:1567-2598(-)
MAPEDLDAVASCVRPCSDLFPTRASTLLGRLSLTCAFDLREKNLRWHLRQELQRVAVKGQQSGFLADDVNSFLLRLALGHLLQAEEGASGKLWRVAPFPYPHRAVKDDGHLFHRRPGLYDVLAAGVEHLLQRVGDDFLVDLREGVEEAGAFQQRHVFLQPRGRLDLQDASEGVVLQFPDVGTPQCRDGPLARRPVKEAQLAEAFADPNLPFDLALLHLEQAVVYDEERGAGLAIPAQLAVHGDFEQHDFLSDHVDLVVGQVENLHEVSVFTNAVCNQLEVVDGLFEILRVLENAQHPHAGLDRSLATKHGVIDKAGRCLLNRVRWYHRDPSGQVAHPVAHAMG